MRSCYSRMALLRRARLMFSPSYPPWFHRVPVNLKEFAILFTACVLPALAGRSTSTWMREVYEEMEIGRIASRGAGSSSSLRGIALLAPRT